MFMTLYGGGAIAPDGTALGPFDDLVIRAARVVGGPTASGRIVAFRGSDGRWLGADGEERRGVASDSPYARHSHLRLHSPGRDLMVRFFAEDTDDPPARAGRELGPYTAITIGPQELRADGELLADRAAPQLPWMSHQPTGTGEQRMAGAVLGVRSGSGPVLGPRPDSVAIAGAGSRVAAESVLARTVPAPETLVHPAPVAVAEPAAEAPAPSPFQFIERVRVDPRIYRARGTAEERDP